LYNAAQLDNHLHRLVCWTSRQIYDDGTGRPLRPALAATQWHAPPVTQRQPHYPWPVLVTLRYPPDRLKSMLQYIGWSGVGMRNDTATLPPVIIEIRLESLKRVKAKDFLLSSWVPVRDATHPTSSKRDDIYLCVDDAQRCPDVTVQLRRAFREPRIKAIPIENVNHREREIVTRNRTKVHDVTPYVDSTDLAIWHAKCDRICAPPSA
jgi:hypothetical protein